MKAALIKAACSLRFTKLSCFPLTRVDVQTPQRICTIGGRVRIRRCRAPTPTPAATEVFDFSTENLQLLHFLIQTIDDGSIRVVRDAAIVHRNNPSHTDEDSG